jgi:two-component system, response regulator
MMPFPVLLVEDNPDHVLIISRGLRGQHVVNEIRVAVDGQEAMDYLYRQGKYAEPEAAPRPGLVLLDIKLPKLNGLEVLQRIKSDPSLKTIPVVMLTSSDQEVDIVKSYMNGANSYVSKPMDFVEFTAAVNNLGIYWVMLNELPKKTLAESYT